MNDYLRRELANVDWTRLSADLWAAALGKHVPFGQQGPGYYQKGHSVMTISKHIGARIRTERENRGWSQADLARRLGITQTAISYWESGTRTIDVDILAQIATALDLRPSELLPATHRESVADRPRRYTKLPVAVEAMRMPVDPTPTEAMEVYQWVERSIGSVPFVPETDDDGNPIITPGVTLDPADGLMVIRTLEGDMKVSPGDYVICGVQGEFYPCKPDIFAATYEEVTDV